MVLLEGDEDEVTTTSTTSATSEHVTRTVDSSATATPSAGTPSDSLDRNVDPKQIMSSSNDIESDSKVPLVNEEKFTDLKEMSNQEQTKLETNEPSYHDDNQNTQKSSDTNECKENEVTLQTPPPTYSMSKHDPMLVDKLETNGKRIA